jgi:FixJ family two-component response regulator
MHQSMFTAVMQHPDGSTERNPAIVVIDDDASMRKALENLFKSVGFDVELYASPQDFLQSERPDRPGCIVLDVRFPGRSGLDMQRDLAQAEAQLPIIFITGYGDIPMSVRAMKAGAIEFLTKPFRDQDLLDAVGTALEKDRARRADEIRLAELRARFETLTARERQVMSLVVAGRLNKQIAGELGVSEMTIKMHRRQVMRKMQAGGVAQLVRLADQLGLSAPQPAGVILDRGRPARTAVRTPRSNPTIRPHAPNHSAVRLRGGLVPGYLTAPHRKGADACHRLGRFPESRSSICRAFWPDRTARC